MITLIGLQLILLGERNTQRDLRALGKSTTPNLMELVQSAFFVCLFVCLFFDGPLCARQAF